MNDWWYRAERAILVGAAVYLGAHLAIWWTL